MNCSCGLWRNLLPHVFTALASVHRPDPTLANGAVYQFGVFQGKSMRMMRHMEPFANAPMIGFDSFEGLPSSLSRSERSEWSPGQFAADPRTELQNTIGREGATAQFVRGFFNESLVQPGLVRQLGKKIAKYVDIDVDLYSSALEALTFMFESGLVVPGTVIGYDDWWSGPCRRGWTASASPLQTSEGLAHAEIARKYGVTFICLAGGCRPGVPCPAFGVIFLGASIGDTPGGDPGFAMSDSDALEFMENDAVCRAKRAVFRAQPNRVSKPPKSVGSVYSRHSPAPRDPGL